MRDERLHERFWWKIRAVCGACHKTAPCPFHMRRYVLIIAEDSYQASTSIRIFAYQIRCCYAGPTLIDLDFLTPSEASCSPRMQTADRVTPVPACLLLTMLHEWRGYCITGL